jgi:hypothetical protein
MALEKETKHDSHDDPDWQKAIRKMFFLGQDDDKDKKPAVPPNVLMEVVSARGLTSISGVDPSCLVRVGEKEVHRTNTIWNDPDPIWTVKTGSLCLLWVPEDEEGEEEEHSVVVEVNHGNQCIGIVMVPFKDVLSKSGDREEFPIRLKPGAKKKGDAKEKDLVSEKDSPVPDMLWGCRHGRKERYAHP